MNTPLRLSQEPVDPTIEAATAHAEDISNTFRRPRVASFIE